MMNNTDPLYAIDQDPRDVDEAYADVPYGDPEDDFLMALYDDRYEDDGHYDDDPNPYDGTYSEM